VFDNFTHIFKRNRIDWEEHPGKKKKSFFRRLFGLKKR